MKLPKLVIFSLMTSTMACGQDSAGGRASSDDFLGPGEVAVVGGERIPESVFRLFTLGALQTNAENLTPEGRAEVVNRLVYMELLAQEAERNSLQQERRIAAELELQRMQLLARSMAQRFTDENPPSEAELRDFYEANLDQIRATRYLTSHILVDTEDEAEDILEELEDGGDFAELAQEFSTDTASASNGGELGWMESETVVEPFAAAMVNATPGEPYSEPVETEYGWHIILVEEVEENAAPGLAAVREEIIAAVEAQKLEAFVESLRESAGVELVE